VAPSTGGLVDIAPHRVAPWGRAMPAATEQDILWTELRWTAVVVGVVTVIMLAIIDACVVQHINPPSNIETIDPKTLHLSGEFTEGNLGTTVDAGGQVTSRVLARAASDLKHDAALRQHTGENRQDGVPVAQK
jgi:hypothetical protein